MKRFGVLVEKHGEHTFVHLALPPGSKNEDGHSIHVLGFNDMDMSREDLARAIGEAVIRVGLQ